MCCVFVYVRSSTDDGFCQLSSTGSWIHTSHAQLPYGPPADHTNGTGMLSFLCHTCIISCKAETALVPKRKIWFLANQMSWVIE